MQLFSETGIIDSASVAAGPIHIEGDNNILVTGSNNTVNITRPTEVFGKGFLSIFYHNLYFQ